jgi:nucleotide-binding universal stress UspA family protein
MTSSAPSLLCPIDFSEFSRRALAHAAAIANHFGARLFVLSVDDPLLTVIETRRELQRFCSATSLSELASGITAVIAPVDLTEASAHQLSVADGIAAALSARLIAVHVLEPLFVPYRVRLALPGAEHTRRVQAEEKLASLVAAIDGAHRSESDCVDRRASEEIVKVTAARNAGLIVMGLYSSGPLDPRMGSVTYRVLCQTDALVLALPSHAVNASSRTFAYRGAAARVAR